MATYSAETEPLVQKDANWRETAGEEDVEQASQHTLPAENVSPGISSDVDEGVGNGVQASGFVLRKCEYCRKAVVGDTWLTSALGRGGVVHVDCAPLEPREKLQDVAYIETHTSSSSANDAVSPSRKCILCNQRSYMRGKATLKEDHKWIKPCFCDVYAHHGCLSAVVKSKRACTQCGESYAYREYGGMVDFFCRYWVHFGFLSLGLLLLFTFCAYCIYNVVVYHGGGGWPSGRITLLLIGVMFTGLFLLSCAACLNYAFLQRLPRFVHKYGYVHVFDYVPRPPLSTSQLEGRRGQSGSNKSTPSRGFGRKKDNTSTQQRSLLSTNMMLYSPRGVPSACGSFSSAQSFQFASTPKIHGTVVPLNFTSPLPQSNIPPGVVHSARMEPRPLHLQLEMVREEECETSSSTVEEEKEQPR